MAKMTMTRYCDDSLMMGQCKREAPRGLQAYEIHIRAGDFKWVNENDILGHLEGAKYQ